MDMRFETWNVRSIGQVHWKQ